MQSLHMSWNTRRSRVEACFNVKLHETGSDFYLHRNDWVKGKKRPPGKEDRCSNLLKAIAEALFSADTGVDKIKVESDRISFRSSSAVVQESAYDLVKKACFHQVQHSL